MFGLCRSQYCSCVSSIRCIQTSAVRLKRLDKRKILPEEYTTTVKLTSIIDTKLDDLKLPTNKRITRLESDIELDGKRLINRNPRNLEQLSFDYKPKGFWLEKSPPNSWNKLVFEQNGRHLFAYLVHWSGKKLIEASTMEPLLTKYIKSTSSTQAAEVLAKVITRRCLQSGFLCASINEDLKTSEESPKSKVFRETVEANGLTLEEPPEITPRSIVDL